MGSEGSEGSNAALLVAGLLRRLRGFFFVLIETGSVSITWAVNTPIAALVPPLAYFDQLAMNGELL